MSPSAVAYTILAGAALYLVSRWWTSRTPRGAFVAILYDYPLCKAEVPVGLKRPPGPSGHFLIGNLLDLPRTKEWLTFNRWANEYGDLFCLNMPGASMLFVNSYELAKELFDKRGNIYSDRYQSTVLGDMYVFSALSVLSPPLGSEPIPPARLKLDRTVLLAQFGEKWRRHRTYFHQFFNQTAAEKYHDVHMKYLKVLLKRLYKSPENYRTHVRYILGASILEVTYGIQAMSEQDPFIVLAETTTARVTQAGIPGTFLVDIFLVMKYIPSWFPGAKFQTELSQLGNQMLEMLDRPLEAAKNNLKNGNARASAVSALIEEFDNDSNRPNDYEDIIKHVTGVAYIAAIDTTNGFLLHFFYTVLLHPEVQKRAQEELDEVVGSGTLPTFGDLGRLKYTRAVFTELLRWNSVAAIGVPHVLNRDDVVNGYFIPKGTIVFGNTWTLLRSKSVYGPDANQFNPDRFLDGRMPYPDFAFGYGRRICPGRYFAENSAFIIVVSILHLFDILPFEDENGPELPAEDHFHMGTMLIPKPFRCRIVPRSSDAIRILEELEH